MPRNLPDSLVRLLENHGAEHAPHYPPSDNSDHGPMAYLAMHGLGIGPREIEAFAKRYRSRLIAAPPASGAIDVARWRDHIGRRESYSALVAFFSNEIAEHGWEPTVAKYLPALISGWVKDAFHPLIRLAYGIEFEAPSEIAAGLAYLTITGIDPRIVDLANARPTELRGREHFDSIRAERKPIFVRGPFNVRYERIVAGAKLAPSGGRAVDTIEELSRACLEIFHATHDFFALHLVTSSHAFRVCTPWAGPGADNLFSVGLACAYLAIGAPEFASLRAATDVLPMAELANAKDEHDVKVAYSAKAHALAFNDATYEWVVARYLAPRLSSNT
jgi:hypothetical protein